MKGELVPAPEAPGAEPPVTPPRGRRATTASRWSFTNIGAVYVWIVVIAVFWVIAPETFGTLDTVKLVLNDQAVTGLVALSIIIPLAAGAYDLTVAYTLGTTAIIVSKLIAETSMSPVLAVVIAMFAALLIGIVNGIVVVVCRIDSFIGTLATSSLLGAVILVVSNNESVSSDRLLGGFSDIARTNLGGITLPVFYMLVVAAALWVLLEHTATGRRLYAVGYAKETARLSGVRTNRLVFGSLIVSALISGFAGVVLTARVTTGSPTIGPPYLLPAFAAAFVGATQLQNGRFNTWGTIIAVLLIGTGTTGLALAGAPIWAPSVFVGVTLIIAVGLTGVKRRSA